MTFDQAIELLKVIGGILGAGGAALYGNAKLHRDIVEMKSKLNTYVTLEEYRLKVSTLHNEINTLRTELAVLLRGGK